MDPARLAKVQAAVAKAQAAHEMMKAKVEAAQKLPKGSKDAPKMVYGADGLPYYDLGEYNIDDQGTYVYDHRASDDAGMEEFAMKMTDFSINITEYGLAMSDWAQAQAAELYGHEYGEYVSDRLGDHDRKDKRRKTRDGTRGAWVRPSAKATK